MKICIQHQLFIFPLKPTYDSICFHLSAWSPAKKSTINNWQGRLASGNEESMRDHSLGAAPSTQGNIVEDLHARDQSGGEEERVVVMPKSAWTLHRSCASVRTAHAVEANYGREPRVEQTSTAEWTKAEWVCERWAGGCQIQGERAQLEKRMSVFITMHDDAM